MGYAQGTQGIAGTDGADGADGNANAISVLFENVLIAAEGNVNLNVPELTQDIVDNGLVIGYVTWLGNSGYYSLPYFEDNGLLKIEIDYYEVGEIRILNYHTYSVDRDFKFIIIESTD